MKRKTRSVDEVILAKEQTVLRNFMQHMSQFYFLNYLLHFLSSLIFWSISGLCIKKTLVIIGDYFSFYYSENSVVIGTWLFIGKQAKQNRKHCI